MLLIMIQARQHTAGRPPPRIHRERGAFDTPNPELLNRTIIIKRVRPTYFQFGCMLPPPGGREFFMEWNGWNAFNRYTGARIPLIPRSSYYMEWKQLVLTLVQGGIPELLGSVTVKRFRPTLNKNIRDL